MGMDVYGKKPRAEVGRYFRRNVWGWHPLADYCREMAPEIASGCTYWHHNSGDGLGSRAAAALGRVLRTTLGDGRAAAYVAIRDAMLTALPDLACDLCGATGIRSDQVGKDAGMHLRVIDKEGHPRHGEAGWCNACDGRGHVRPFETHYYLEVADIEAFAAFLETCGGFEIC